MADFSELINCDDCGSSFVLTVVDAELEVTSCPFCKADLDLAEAEEDEDEEDDYGFDEDE